MEGKLALFCVMNLLVLVCGAVIFGLAVDMNVRFASGWGVVGDTSAVGFGIFLGIFMIFNSLLGCCYVTWKRRPMLFIVNVFFMIVQFALLIVLAYLLIDANNTAQAQVESGSASPQLAPGSQQAMNNALLSVFNKCCSGCDQASLALFTNNAQATCNNLGSDFAAAPPPFCNTSRQEQEFPGEDIILCETPGPCFSASEDCWVLASSSADQNFPPVHIDQSFCDALAKTSDSNGEPLVGYPQDGGCGQGTIRTFVDQMTDYFASQMYVTGVLAAVFASLLLSATIVGVYCTTCRHKRAASRSFQEEAIVI